MGSKSTFIPRAPTNVSIMRTETPSRLLVHGIVEVKMIMNLVYFRFTKCSVVSMSIVMNTGFSSIQILHIDAVLTPQFRKLGGRELNHERVNVFRCLRRNEANAELT